MRVFLIGKCRAHTFTPFDLWTLTINTKKKHLPKLIYMRVFYWNSYRLIEAKSNICVVSYSVCILSTPRIYALVVDMSLCVCKVMIYWSGTSYTAYNFLYKWFSDDAPIWRQVSYCGTVLCVLRFDEVVHLHGVYELDGGVGWAMMFYIEDAEYRWRSCVPTLICM